MQLTFGLNPSISIDNLSDTRWSQLIGEDYVFLIGSGVSSFEPTNLPSGQGVSDYIYSIFENYLQPSKKQGEILEKWFRTIPFEVLMERCIDSEGINTWLESTYSNTKSNEAHKFITKQALKSQTKFIITTNYDTGLETAFSEFEEPYQIVVTNKETSSNPNVPIIFKIHGSADSRYPNSLVFKLSQESRMPKWKKKFLKKKIKGKTLIIIGYSGLDFEICPELCGFEPTRIIWNFFRDSDLESSPGLKYHVIPKANNIPIVPVIGDMFKLFFEVWENTSKSLKPKYSQQSLEISNIAKNVQKFWAYMILQALGIGDLNGQIEKNLNYSEISNYLEPYLFYKHIGRSMYFAGDIEKTEYYYNKAIQKAPYRKKIDCILILANVELQKRKLVEASKLLKMVSSLWKYTNKNSRAKFFLYRASLARKYFDLNDQNIHAKRNQFFKQKIKVLLENAAVLFADSGDYSDLNACWLLARQAKLDLEFDESETIIPSREGFYHLGYKLPEMIEFRYMIMDKDTLNAEELSKLKKFLYEAKVLKMGEYNRLKAVAEVLNIDFS